MLPPNVPVAFACAPLTKQEHVAIKAIFNGTATSDEQLTFLSVLVKKISRTHDMPYIPGSFDESAFLAGRGFVGQQLIKLNNQPVSDEQ